MADGIEKRAHSIADTAIKVQSLRVALQMYESSMTPISLRDNHTTDHKDLMELLLGAQQQFDASYTPEVQPFYQVSERESKRGGREGKIKGKEKDGIENYTFN